MTSKMILLASLVLAAQFGRHQQDNIFVKVLDDTNMRETIKKVENCFVFFHADHIPLSDSAYLNYIDVAYKYKYNSTFYVVPAAVGADVMRTYSVPGSPALLHFRYGIKNGIHYGLFSHKSIENFIHNYTRNPIIPLEIPDNATEMDIFNTISANSQDRHHCLVLFCDEETQFGRAALKMSAELSPYFLFVQIKNPSAAKTFGVRFPSIVLLRYPDSQRFVYTGDADPDEMFIWIQPLSVPAFKRIDNEKLFSIDGVSVRNVVVFVDGDDDRMMDRAYRALGHFSNAQNWVRGWYADMEESRALASLLNITKAPATAYLSCNYTHISFSVLEGEILSNKTTALFLDDALPMLSVATPPALFGDLRPVTEYAFERLAEEGPFFALFTSAFCVRCKALRMAAIDAAAAIRRAGGRLRWALWDVTKATPSFQREIDLGVPSVWFFPGANASDGVQYGGPQNFLSIAEWAYTMQPEFDVEKVMAHELGNRFDEI